MKNKKNDHEKLASLRIKLMQIKILNVFKYLFYYLDTFLLLFIKKSKSKCERKKVLIIANLGIGDAINFLSVIDKYRNYYSKKKYHITLLVPPGIDKIFKEESDFDNIIDFNTNSALFSLKKRIQLFKLINQNNYDILVDPMGATGASMNVYLSHACNAKEKITIVNKATSTCPPFLLKKSYTNIFNINNKYITNIEYYNQLIDYISSKVTEIKFHKTKTYKVTLKIPKDYYIVFPSASENIKKWDYEKYAQIIKKIYNKTKLPVLFCGTSIDLESVNSLINLIDVPFINIIGETSILEFIQIIKQAKFVITNDTGAYHIAINEEVPVAIIVGGYTFDGFVKYDFKNNHYQKPYIITNKRDCFNCFSNCPYLKRGAKKYPCLNSISIEYAWNIIKKMINDLK